MMKIGSLLAVSALALGLGACGETRNERTLSGALIGTAAGAAIGGAVTGKAGGAAGGRRARRRHRRDHRLGIRPEPAPRALLRGKPLRRARPRSVLMTAEVAWPEIVDRRASFGRPFFSIARAAPRWRSAGLPRRRGTAPWPCSRIPAARRPGRNRARCPAPACTNIRPSFTTAVRSTMQVSISPSAPK